MFPQLLPWTPTNSWQLSETAGPSTYIQSHAAGNLWLPALPSEKPIRMNVLICFDSQNLRWKLWVVLCVVALWFSLAIGDRSKRAFFRTYYPSRANPPVSGVIMTALDLLNSLICDDDDPQLAQKLLYIRSIDIWEEVKQNICESTLRFLFPSSQQDIDSKSCFQLLEALSFQILVPILLSSAEHASVRPIVTIKIIIPIKASMRRSSTKKK